MDRNNRMRVELPKKAGWKILGAQNIFEKGGSKAIVIPKNVVRYLDLASGEKLLFLLDVETGDVIVGTEDHFKVQIRDRLATFAHPMSSQELERIISRLKDKGTIKK